MLMISKTNKIIFLAIIFLALPLIARADYLGQRVKFNIDPSYDLYGREDVSATLAKITEQLYFYVDEGWWEKLGYSSRQGLDAVFYDLGREFERKIYTTLTATFGLEPKPGVDNDEKITILIHPMISEAGGYFNSGDVYEKLQNPRSNQREMVYLNSRHVDKDQVKILLAHEFTHLITANQKELLRGVSEEIWLNEARAEYSATLLGYDDVYKGSNLEKRARNFLDKPGDSLTEWLNKSPDYGVVNLFTQYLVDHYGVKILNDSLQSSKVGIPSLNEALQKNGFKKDFSQIFTDWLITVLINDCNFGSKYCYLNPNLKNLKITPLVHFLPPVTEGSLAVSYSTKEWAGNWQKIIGGKGILIFEFDGQADKNFNFLYIICDYQEKCAFDFLNLDKDQKGEITLAEFDTKYISLTIIPFIQTKTLGYNGSEPSYQFSWMVSTKEQKSEAQKEAELISRLLAQIEDLKRQISEVQAKIDAILYQRGNQQGATPCRFDNNLYFGMRNNPEVSCLQEFLKSQGMDIYPEGLVSGNFLYLTQLAVIRFQEKYRDEILRPLGLERGTGYVGQATRAKINQILGL